VLTGGFNSKWPLFVYGALKPGEISWPMISELVENPLESYVEDHQLVMAGGLPMAIPRMGKKVQGHIVQVNAVENAILVIEALEGINRVYKWSKGKGPDGWVNILVPVKPPTKLSEIEAWSTADDPYFGMVIPHVHATLKKSMLETSKPVLTTDAYYNYLDLQAAYLLLWTLFERILLFTRANYLTGSKMTKKESRKTIEKIEWKKAIELTASNQQMSVVPADDVFGKAVRFTENQFLFFYQMRNNIVHRGKSASADQKQLLKAAVLFLNVQSAFLQLQYPVLDKLWSTMWASESHTNLKYQINPKEVK
jgi:hypothetical protein